MTELDVDPAADGRWRATARVTSARRGTPASFASVFAQPARQRGRTLGQCVLPAHRVECFEEVDTVAIRGPESDQRRSNGTRRNRLEPFVGYALVLSTAIEPY